MEKETSVQWIAAEGDGRMTSGAGPEGNAGAAIAESPVPESTVPESPAPWTTRFWEVDSWRGVAIITMIIFHLMYDLRSFGGLPVILHTGFWFYFQRFTAVSFIALAGVAVVLSYNRALAKQGSANGLAWKVARRGLHILGIGMIFTLVMRVGGFARIDFGVLHLIGISIICAIPFLRMATTTGKADGGGGRGWRWMPLAAAGVFYGLSFLLNAMEVQTAAGVYWLVPLGIEPPGYYFADYFPFPHWFPVFLIGVFLGGFLYQGGVRKLALPNLEGVFPFSFLQLLGRHSLVIYVIHQPALIGLLLLTGSISLG